MAEIKKEIKRKERKALRLMNEGKYDDAIILLEENFATDIYSDVTYDLLWRCYYERDGEEKLIETLKRIILKCEENKFNCLEEWKNHLNFKEHVFNQRKFELEYPKDMKLAIDNVAIGDKLWGKREFDEAIKHYEMALEMGYFDSKYCEFLGKYYHFKRDFEKERETYKLIIKNIKKSPYKWYLPQFEDKLANVESFLNNGEWLFNCLPFDVFNHYEIVEKLYEAKKLLKTDERDKGINLLEELIEKGTYINEVYYELYLTYNRDKKYDDSLRICEKAIEVLGFFSNERLLAWIKHKNTVTKRIKSNKRV